MSVSRFAIYSPTMGLREDVPGILLDKAFTRDNMNVQIWEHEIRKMKLRTKEMVRTIYPVSTLDTSSNTISISGNHVSDGTVLLAMRNWPDTDGSATPTARDASATSSRIC